MIDQQDIPVCELESFKIAFGKVVERHRVAEGLGQRAFARVAGIGNSHLRLIESGGVNLSFATAFKISSALGVALFELVREAEILAKEFEVPARKGC